MNELFVPYEIAVMAKEKEFNEPCLGVYSKNRLFIGEHHGFNLGNDILAPLYQQLFDWFREKHNIIIEIQLDQTSDVKFCIAMTKFNDTCDFDSIMVPQEIWGYYRDYYKDLDFAFKYAFKTQLTPLPI